LIYGFSVFLDSSEPRLCLRRRAGKRADSVS
jgi:hypothetical protein